MLKIKSKILQDLSRDSIIIYILYAFCFLVMSLISLRYLPLNEGWLQTIPYLIEKKIYPYKDFEYVFPPLVPSYYFLLSKIIGISFINNRIFGLFFTLGCSLILVLIYQKEFAYIPALLTGLSYFVFQCTYPTYIAGDYHTLYDFWVILIFLLSGSLSNQANKVDSYKNYLTKFFLGILVSLCFLTKQNIGVLLYAGLMLSFLIDFIVSIKENNTKKILFNIIIFNLGFLSITIGIGMYFAPKNYLEFILSFLKVNSKGSMFYSGTRFLHDSGTYQILLAGYFLSLILLLLIRFQKKLGHILANFLMKNKIIQYLVSECSELFAFFLLIMLFGQYIVQTNTGFKVFDLITFCGIVLLMMELQLNFVSIYINGLYSLSNLSCRRLILFSALIYAGTLTAGINYMSSALIISYYTAFLINKLRILIPTYINFEKNSVIYKVVGFIIIMTISLNQLMVKARVPYSWWGEQEASIFGEYQRADIVPISGLYINPIRIMLFKNYMKFIEENTAIGEPILAYPDIPLFYIMANRLPVTRTYVQWFDVSRPETLRDDFLKVVKNPPKIVVELVQPESVYVGHLSLLGSNSIQKEFSNYLKCMVETGNFAVLFSQPYNISENGKVFYRFNLIKPGKVSDLQEIEVMTKIKFSSFKLKTAFLNGLPLAYESVLFGSSEYAFDSFEAEVGMNELESIIKYFKLKNLAFPHNNLELRILKNNNNENNPNSICQEDYIKNQQK